MGDMSRAQFEAKRAEMIDALLAMKVEDDPHAILAVGDHKEFSIHTMACNSFKADVALRMLESASRPVTLDEGT